MSIGLLSAVFAMLGWGVANGVTRTPAIRIGVINTLLYRNLFVLLLLLPAALYFSGWEKVRLDAVLYTFVLSAIGYLSLLALFKAQKTGKVGILNPIAATLGSLITFGVGIVVYGERIGAVQTLAVFMVLVGVVLGCISFTAFKESHLFRKDSGIGYAILTGVCWGVMFGFMFEPIKLMGPFWTAVVLNVGNLVFSVIHLLVLRQKVVKPDGISLGVTFLAGIGGAVAIAAYNFAVANAPISLVAGIVAANPLVAIIVGLVFYKERHTLQPALGMVLALAGVVLIGLAR